MAKVATWLSILPVLTLVRHVGQGQISWLCSRQVSLVEIVTGHGPGQVKPARDESVLGICAQVELARFRVAAMCTVGKARARPTPF